MVLDEYSESLGPIGGLADGDNSDKMRERYHCVTLPHLEEGPDPIPTKLWMSQPLPAPVQRRRTPQTGAGERRHEGERPV